VGITAIPALRDVDDKLLCTYVSKLQDAGKKALLADAVTSMGMREDNGPNTANNVRLAKC
jgi:hypothetical protein